MVVVVGDVEDRRWRIWYWWDIGDKEDSNGNDGGVRDENVDGVESNFDEDV